LLLLFQGVYRPRPENETPFFFSEVAMELSTQIYEFAASAGALEGFVYRREGLRPEALDNWIGHLCAAYQLLPEEEKKRLQPSINGTIGRAVRSIEALLGPDHAHATKLRSLLRGPLPESPDDFQKKKWFEGPEHS
jgi:hypothetical protein